MRPKTLNASFAFKNIFLYLWDGKGSDWQGQRESENLDQTKPTSLITGNPATRAEIGITDQMVVKM